jgi:hypothetical protein
MPNRAGTSALRAWRWCALVAGLTLVANVRAMPGPAATGATLVLYDGALGTTPDKQGFQYQAINGENPFLPAAATQAFANAATTLDTTPQKRDLAGYAATNTTSALPVLNRGVGYSVSFTVQIQQENHAGSDKNGDGLDDRAGFSITVISSDKKGIELGFWPDKIWAQQDGAAAPPSGTLFTHAEEAVFNTTADLISYTLTIAGDSYRLVGAAGTLLSGRVRDYTAFVPPPPFDTDPKYNPYRTPNLIVLSDNSTSASAKTRLSYVGFKLRDAVYIPLVGD